MTIIDSRTGKPKVKLASLVGFSSTEQLIKKSKLNTICESGLCPNKRECWQRGTATFMILGDTCTRGCLFCGVKKGLPGLPNRTQIQTLAQLVRTMHLKHVVLTSVTRDDLPDRGAQYWADTIREIKLVNNDVSIETLIPDFDGNEHLIDKVIAEKPEIISHNIETVERITGQVRSRATYATSLTVLAYLASRGVCVKSGLMLGLGEQPHEVKTTLRELKSAGCTIVTIGQYYSPSVHHVPVTEIIAPAMFDELGQYARSLGFLHVESGTLVRSSYHAETHVR